MNIRVDSLCFDGIVLDFEGLGNFEELDQSFTDIAEKSLHQELGYKLTIADKTWDTSIVLDADEELFNEDDINDFTNEDNGGAALEAGVTDDEPYPDEIFKDHDDPRGVSINGSCVQIDA